MATVLLKCAYCGKEKQASELESGQIWFRTRKNGVAVVGKKTNLYCKNEPCHGYDQMAHEG